MAVAMRSGEVVEGRAGSMVGSAIKEDVDTISDKSMTEEPAFFLSVPISENDDGVVTTWMNTIVEP